MTLELARALQQIEEIGDALAAKHERQVEERAVARQVLRDRAVVDDRLRHMIALARQQDAGWRGAEPLCAHLDEHRALGPSRAVTLIASDGSQIYPDRHSVALYCLINVGTIILRQGSGEAPMVSSLPVAFLDSGNLFADDGRTIDVATIGREREHRALRALTELAEQERAAMNGDLSRPIIAMPDGPLLPWTPLKVGRDEMRREAEFFCQQMDCMKAAHVVPVGCIDRSGAANILRTLELLALDEITRDNLRSHCFGSLVDRDLLDDLDPGTRSGLFAVTSEMNALARERGHRVAFFYMNASWRGVNVLRIELPEWAVDDADLVQQAIFADCECTDYPYVLIRAHELAVVNGAERTAFEEMLEIAMLRRDLSPRPSSKEAGKRLLRG